MIFWRLNFLFLFCRGLHSFNVILWPNHNRRQPCENDLLLPLFISRHCLVSLLISCYPLRVFSFFYHFKDYSHIYSLIFILILSFRQLFQLKLVYQYILVLLSHLDLFFCIFIVTAPNHRFFNWVVWYVSRMCCVS